MKHALAMTDTSSEHTQPGNWVHEITLPGPGVAIGHQISGSRRGPMLLVIGQDDVVAPVYRRIMALPRLPFIRGDLILAHFCAARPDLDNRILDHIEGQMGPVDDTLHLVGRSEDTAELYWSILRFCTQYGMISGRGVPVWHPELVDTR